MVALAIVSVALSGGCGIKPRTHEETPQPVGVENPTADGEATPDIDKQTDETEQEVPLPMDTEFIEWAVDVDERPQPGRIDDRISRKLTFRLTNTLDRLLTGQIVLDLPQGVSVVHGETIGWRLRGKREVALRTDIAIVQGAPLGLVEVPLTINVLGEEYRRGRLYLYKWLDVRIVGPFPPAGGPDASYPPDEKVDFDRPYEWKGGTYTWRPVPINALQPDGMIDFQQILGASATGTAYAALHLNAEAATGVVLAFTCDSPGRVLLNGRVVLDAPKPLEQEKAVEVVLQKGRNTLLVRCARGKSGWACRLNVVGKLGELPPGVTFDLVLRGVLEREPSTLGGESAPVEGDNGTSADNGSAGE